MLNFCDFIQDYVFSINHHLNMQIGLSVYWQHKSPLVMSKFFTDGVCVHVTEYLVRQGR